MAENYNVGIRVSLVDAVSAGIAAMAMRFKGAEAAAVGFKRELKSIERTLATGALQVGIGVGIIAMFKPALDQAKQFQREVTKYSLFGMGEQANREAVHFAKSMNIMGSSYVDTMRLMTESQGIFRESGKRTLAEQLEGAKIASPILAKLAFIQSGLSDDQKASRHAQDLSMLRFIEARGGANDPRIFASIADWGFKLQQSSGGVVDWSQLQQMVAAAGPMTRTMTQDAISKLEPVIADLKGGRVGSGLRVSFQRLLGTQRGLPRQAVAEYLNLGLWDPSKVELTKQGSVKRFLGAPGDVFKYGSRYMADPTDFFANVFLPAITKKYGAWILGNDAKAVAARSTEESMVFGPGTASQLFSQIDKLLPAIQRSLAAQGRQQGIDAAYKATGGTLAGKEIALHKRFNDLLEQTGEVVLPIAVMALDALQPPLKWLGDFGTAHPRLFGFLVDGLLGLGVATAGAGIFNLLKGLGGLVKLFAPIAGIEGTLGIASLASKIPLIGAGLADAALDVGIFIAAITAPGWLAIGGIAATVTALGIALHEMEKHAPAATKKMREDARRGAGQFVGAFFSTLADDFNSRFVSPMKRVWNGFVNWLGGAGNAVMGWLKHLQAQLHGIAPALFADPNAKPSSVAKHPPVKGMTATQSGQLVAKLFEHGAIGLLPGMTLVAPALTSSNNKLAGALNGLSSRLSTVAPQAIPQSNHGPKEVHLHLHGVSDPHKIARQVSKILTGGPQHGSSNFDPSAVMPQVGTRYAA